MHVLKGSQYPAKTESQRLASNPKATTDIDWMPVIVNHGSFATGKAPITIRRWLLMAPAYVQYGRLSSNRGYIVAWHYARPGQRPDRDPPMSLGQKLHNSRFLVPVILLVLAVIGSMYLGYATPTEAAAIGVIGALVLAAAQGSLNWRTFSESMMGAVSTSAMVAFILMGASFLSLSMGFTGLPRALAEWIASLDLSVYTLIIALTIFYIVIGCFLDGISAVVLTMAVIEPMVNIPAFREVGFSMIWFGIFVTVVVEMAQITPPIGFNLFVLQGMTRYQMSYIAKTAAPMFLIMVLMVGVLVLWPELATWLPETARQGPGG